MYFQVTRELWSDKNCSAIRVWKCLQSMKKLLSGFLNAMYVRIPQDWCSSIKLFNLEIPIENSCLELCDMYQALLRSDPVTLCLRTWLQ
jgi:hypothetical protein